MTSLQSSNVVPTASAAPFLHSIPEWNTPNTTEVIHLVNLRMGLADLLREMNELSRQSDTFSIRAALLVIEIRKRVERGDAGRGVKWMEFAMTSMPLKKSRIYLLERVGRANNPQKELALIWNEQREARKKHDDKKAGAPAKQEPARRELCEWAARAPTEAVLHILELAQHEWAIALS